MNKQIITLIIGFLCITSLMGQTTGKIAGTVTDSETGEPLIGVNVILDGTGMGAVTDIDGYYTVINVKPGSYTIRISMIGYEVNVLEDVRVSTNRTTYLDADLGTTLLEGAEVIVTASKISTKKDQTSTVKNISSEDIEVLPVESVSAVVEMQAGVVAGHFRGGRSGEVSYLIDGIQVDEVFGGNNAVVSIETEAVQDLEVITGTFNAEYGKAMSGIVNAVTKDGASEFHGSFSSSIASYVTQNTYEDDTEIFPGLDPFGLNTNYDNKFTLSGPVIADRVGFFINYRTQSIAGHLNGVERFNVWDQSSYYTASEFSWQDENTGDSSYVPMSNSENSSLMAKLSFRFGPKIRSSLMYNLNTNDWQSYDHFYKYNPNGLIKNTARTDFYAFQLNHLVTNNLFYDVKVNRTNNYYGSYLFEDPLSYTIAEETEEIEGTWYAAGDTVYNYKHDKYFNSFGPGFLTGGQAKDHTERTTITDNFKVDVTWQATKRHSFKSGFQITNHDISNTWRQVRNLYFGDANLEDNYKPVTFDNNSPYADIYEKQPTDVAMYIQDKMEFDAMVLNIGIRYDSFDANTSFPTQLRNPANASLYVLKDSSGNIIYDENGDAIEDPERMSRYPDSETVTQLSPRLGLAYQLGNKAVLHFSYGHFFQMPAYYAIYGNDALYTGLTNFSQTLGNGNLGADSLGLNPQKTVSYEVGLWQELTPEMGVEVNLYYRDIYDLLTVATVSTYNNKKYGLYTNKDYGNVRGLEIKLDYGYQGIRFNTNYTLQYTKGNADNPSQTYSRAGAAIDPVKKMIPMSWDQRHTLNVSMGYSAPRYGAHLTAYFNSGTAYTFSPRPESQLLSKVNLAPNNDYRSAGYHVDMTGYLLLPKVMGVNAKLNFSIYNLLDRYNEVWVNSRTGRAYSDIAVESEVNGHRSTFNEHEDRYKNPAMFTTPRQVKIGLEVSI